MDTVPLLWATGRSCAHGYQSVLLSSPPAAEDFFIAEVENGTQDSQPSEIHRMISPEQLSLVANSRDAEVMDLTEEHVAFGRVQHSLLGSSLPESIFESSGPVNPFRNLLTAAALNPAVFKL